jgi:hypothetical protein
MGCATTAPGRSVDYIVKQMCEHICEPIQSTGRILPGEPGFRMWAENTVYINSTYTWVEPLVPPPFGGEPLDRRHRTAF